MIAVQILTAVLAAGFTIWYASDSQRSLASVAISARLDALAEEIERRAPNFDVSLAGFSEELKLDMTYRFPDALVLIDLNGNLSERFQPSSDGFEGLIPSVESSMAIPSFASSDEVLEDVYVDFSDEDVPGGFASAPLFDETGFPVGIVLIQPIRNSLMLELADTRTAFRRSIRIVAGLSILIALLLGAFFTWWLVKPLRSMANKVERIGQGSYDERLEIKGKDEIASLSMAINTMSDRVEESIEVLRESEVVRRELIANVGHDLRTPLTAIRAHIEESLRFHGEGHEGKALKSLRSAEQQSVYLGRLIDDLFELGVLESAVPRLRREPVLPAELISDAIAGFEVLANTRSQTIRSATAPDVLPIDADGTRLLRVLNNLISNSIRHTPNGGDIVIEARIRAGHLEISVADNGDGVAPEKLARLFDRYYRGDDSRTRSDLDLQSKGTGLGLAISRAIAEAHGGTLSASSVVGKGTTMLMRLPLKLEVGTA